MLMSGSLSVCLKELTEMTFILETVRNMVCKREEQAFLLSQLCFIQSFLSLFLLLTIRTEVHSTKLKETT